MDVTFTNVLEGARQYFQGLPAATSSTASPSYTPEQHRTSNIPEQQNHAADSRANAPPNVPYWGSQEPQNAPSNERTHHQQQHQQESPRTHSQEQTRAQTYNYGDHGQFNFSRPQSREAPSNVLQQQQYQSHILPNPAYQQPQTTQQNRVPSRQPQELNTQPQQSYYQLQTPQIHNPNQSYHDYQQRGYYPVQTQMQQVYSTSSTNQNNYKPVTSSASNELYYNQKMYTSNSQQNTTQYTPKTSEESSYSTQSQMVVPQNKTTHNLPPIAAISSVSYHSSRSNRDLRLQQAKSRTNSITVPQSTPQYSNHYSQRVNYSTESNHSDYNTVTYSTQKVQQHQTATTYANTNSTSTYSAVPPQSQSSSHYYQYPNKVTQEIRRPVQQSTNTNVQNNRVVPTPATPVVAKLKRESPLDLSVKTVRTSADSTLDDAEVTGKYNRGAIQQTQQSHSYPTFDVYANSFHRNLTQRTTQNQSASAPKMDFHPNFNMPALNQSQNYPNARRVQQYEKSVNQRLSNPVHRQVSASNTGLLQQYTQSVVKKPDLPRVDFSATVHKSSVMYPVPPHDVQRKRHGEPAPAFVPSKIPKVESWRQTIDQQIEQKLSSYKKGFQTQQQQNKPLVNGSSNITSYNRPYALNQHNQNYAYQTPQTNHNQTYVPSAAAHVYPNTYPPHSQYGQHLLNRSNSNPSLQQIGANRNSRGGADKHVLNLLRNSLEIKGAKEAQKKLEQEQFKMQDIQQHSRAEVQQPSTDVTAPLQPKSYLGRHNISPFPASSINERSSNTPPIYKFHLPKAIDSVRFDVEVPIDRVIDAGQNNTDLDGLAAFLAARIRTKAELKQVGPTNNNTSSPQVKPTPSPQVSMNSSSSGGSPPKLVKEKPSFAPRRRLFSRNEDDTGVLTTVPPRDKSGLRSSSETSVFDFPDTDSEGEMPVLERQSLEEMRRDRKFFIKQSPVDVKVEVPERTPSPFDEIFDQACNNIMEQLKLSNGKKRGRRKKMVEPEVIAMLEETVIKEKPLEIDVVVTVKEEKVEEPTEEIKIEPKVESESDSDAPLSKCKKKGETAENDEEEIKTTKKSGRRKLDTSSESSSDSELESNKPLNKQHSLSLSATDLTEKSIQALNKITKAIKKPTFGDGTAFHPGWEEEVYKYKRSLRMPPSLIQLTRPPNCQRLSTSLPDLDPCPNSPTASSVTDNAEYSTKMKVKVKSESIDSDMDSNSSFSFSFSNKNYDSEGSSSIRSLNSPKDNNSILDKLLERYGKKKKRKYKKKDEVNGPKIIPKAENTLELLATPSLEIGETKKVEEKTKSPIVKLDSVILGFRKKTVSNFKDAFMNNSSNIVNEQFATVVLQTRTRTESRVLKQRATIKEVFGEDRPASAPPITCIDDIKTEEIETKPTEELQPLKDRQFNSDVSAKQALKNKLLGREKKTPGNLLKLLANKKIKTEYPEGEENIVHIKQEPDCKSETPSLDGDDSSTQGRKRGKFRNMRRKFSSGFDYIRKKKKQVKKEENNESAKPKRRGLLPKATPESVQDIQKEIKMWVLNKGIGETHLHRAARLGYTDITAYCLEKMNCPPSPKDNAGYTPLHEACSRGHLTIAKLLLKYGANVSESAQGGIRPLHEAVENGFVEIVRLLLSYGADPLLATYSGLTPLALANDETMVDLLQHHLDDLQGEPSIPWIFLGPATCFDNEESGYDPLEEVPEADAHAEEEEDVEFEISEAPLPNLYTLRGEPPGERWILLQDLSNLLRIKSRDALIRQITSQASSSAITNNKTVLKELKMSEFLEQAHCCQFMNGSEKVNTRASKIALVKYTDKVKQLLNVEKILISVR